MRLLMMPMTWRSAVPGQRRAITGRVLPTGSDFAALLRSHGAESADGNQDAADDDQPVADVHPGVVQTAVGLNGRNELLADLAQGRNAGSVQGAVVSVDSNADDQEDDPAHHTQH